ncbi:MAG: MBL fold metallo-hydrolase [Clostridia bacterium]|nr:MBL fold metallo-hydrolase [Clostridia bacterium]
MQVKRLLHNTVVVDCKVGCVVFDPYLIPPDTHLKADYIFITHSHYDHFSPEDILKISGEDTKMVCPKGMETDVLPVVEQIEGLKITRVAAYNIGKQFHKPEHGGLGYIIDDGTASLYVAGDTDFIPEMREIRCDICALPIGGTYTMDAREAAMAANAIRPKQVIPTHYGDIPSVADAQAVGELKSLLDPAIECIVF